MKIRLKFLFFFSVVIRGKNSAPFDRPTTGVLRLKSNVKNIAEVASPASVENLAVGANVTSVPRKRRNTTTRAWADASVLLRWTFPEERKKVVFYSTSRRVISKTGLEIRDTYVYKRDFDRKVPMCCGECNLKFRSVAAFQEHGQEEHPGEKIFVCGIRGCEASYELATSLRRHRFQHHSRSKRVNVAILKDEPGEKETSGYRPSNIVKYCSECDEHFLTLADYELHGLKRHPKKKLYRCEQKGCRKGFTQSSNLYAHERKVHGKMPQSCGLKNAPKMICDRCSQHFFNIHQFELHYKREHGVEVRYKCAICPATFNKKKNCCRHENTMHASAQNRCKNCKRTFRRLDTLRMHEIRCKNWRKKDDSEGGNDAGAFLCDRCGKRYSKGKQELFQRHLTYHKLFVSCPICGAGFNAKFARNRLTNHVQVHHGDEYDDVDFEKVLRNEGNPSEIWSDGVFRRR